MSSRPELKELITYLESLIESGSKISSVSIEFIPQDGGVCQERFNYHMVESLQRVQKDSRIVEASRQIDDIANELFKQYGQLSPSELQAKFPYLIN